MFEMVPQKRWLRCRLFMYCILGWCTHFCSWNVIHSVLFHYMHPLNTNCTVWEIQTTIGAPFSDVKTPSGLQLVCMRILSTSISAWIMQRVSRPFLYQMQDRCTSSEWTGCSAKVTDNCCINISLIFVISTILMHLHHLLSCGTSTRPQEGACVSRPRSKILTFSIRSSSLQPREWVRISCHHFIFYFYYSTALSLITNDGYNDLCCAKSLLTCGWK